MGFMEFIRPGLLIDFMKIRHYAYAASATILGVCLVSIIFQGLNYGIDFTGGTEVQVVFKTKVITEDVRKAMKNAGFEAVRIQTMGGYQENEFLIRLPKMNTSGKDMTVQVAAALSGAFGKDKVEIRRAEMVGSEVSQDLKQKGFLSLLYAGIALLIYIWVRFQLSYSIGAILAIVHDVIVTVGAFSLTGREVSLTVIAAVLTIIGYSLNDTIVIFDRIRENIKKATGTVDITTVVNESVSQTLGRTILTSLTVFIVVMCLFLIGGSVINDFAFAMIIGVVSGSYSTIFIASPIMVFFNKKK
ncbi:MAG TPA: protein translocase subunit SecF [Desulfomonilia bacterium]|nr:protein translocase subunit SecF [Desulfomonilia bacterium]